MTQPGSIGSQIPWRDESDLAREIADLKRRLQQLESNALGRNGIVVNGPPGITVQGGAGITVDDGGTVTVDGGDIIVQGGGSIRSANFNGNLDTGTPGTQGWGLGGDLDMLAVAVAAFKSGLIGNDALTNPVMPLANGAAVGNAAFGTTANTTMTSCTLTVPTGFTKVQLSTYLAVAGLNPGGGADNLWGRIRIPGIGVGVQYPMGVPAGLSTINFSQHNILATGLTSGQVITVEAEAWVTVAGWPSSASNFVQLGVVGQFHR